MMQDELYGNNVESIENVKEWIQDIFQPHQRRRVPRP